MSPELAWRFSAQVYWELNLPVWVWGKSGGRGLGPVGRFTGGHYRYFNNCIHLCIYFWLCRVSIAPCGRSLEWLFFGSGAGPLTVVAMLAAEHRLKL